jgi:hypothetical protein
MSKKIADFQRILAFLLLFCLIEGEFIVDIALASVKDSVCSTDINNDGIVNMLDLDIIARAFGAFSGDPNWNSKADLNRDGKVNIIDVRRLAKDYGTSGTLWLDYHFEEPLDWNVRGGTWSVHNGLLEGSSNGEGLIYAEGVIWGDCILTAKVKIAADSPKAEAAFIIHFVDSGNFYWAGLGCWGHKVSISSMINYIPKELAFTGDRAEVVRDVWYVVVIKISGNTIMLYVDGSLELVVNDLTFASGSVGIRTYDSHVIVDYLTVNGRAAQVLAHNVLYADGTKLRDPSGKEVILVGTQCDYNVLSKEVWFGLDDVQRIKSYGGNVVEIHALLLRELMGDRAPVINQSWIERLDKWVSWCEQAQVYYIISFGNFEYKPWGREAPVWLVEGKYTSWDKNMWNQASIDFWDIDNQLQEDNRQRVLDFFRFIANRYKNNKYVIFGLFNEPFCGNDLVTWQNAKHLSTTYARFVERIVDAIRSTGAKQLIFVDKPYVWFYTDHFEPVNREGIVWEDHLYVTPNYNLNQWKTELNGYVELYVNTFHKPFYVGEYGFIDYSYEAHINNRFTNWKTVLTEQVAFLKNIPICGYSWHEYPWLEGEYYDYVYNSFTKDDSDYILQTIFG